LHLRVVRATQPTGPYLLAGWSHARAPEPAESIASFVRYVEAVHGWRVGDVASGLDRLPAGRRMDTLFSRARKAGLATDAELDILRRIFTGFEHDIASLLSYTPAPYTDRITLFRAAEPRPEFLRDPRFERDERHMGWSGLADHVEVIDVTGNHVSLLTEPRVRQLAERLTDCLERARHLVGRA
jgi:thioesterase domain-containing protein